MAASCVGTTELSGNPTSPAGPPLETMVGVPGVARVARALTISSMPSAGSRHPAVNSRMTTVPPTAITPGDVIEVVVPLAEHGTSERVVGIVASSSIDVYQNDGSVLAQVSIVSQPDGQPHTVGVGLRNVGMTAPRQWRWESKVTDLGTDTEAALPDWLLSAHSAARRRLYRAATARVWPHNEAEHDDQGDPPGTGVGPEPSPTGADRDADAPAPTEDHQEMVVCAAAEALGDSAGDAGNISVATAGMEVCSDSNTTLLQRCDGNGHDADSTEGTDGLERGHIGIADMVEENVGDVPAGDGRARDDATDGGSINSACDPGGDGRSENAKASSGNDNGVAARPPDGSTAGHIGPATNLGTTCTTGACDGCDGAVQRRFAAAPGRGTQRHGTSAGPASTYPITTPTSGLSAAAQGPADGMAVDRAPPTPARPRARPTHTVSATASATAALPGTAAQPAAAPAPAARPTWTTRTTAPSAAWSTGAPTPAPATARPVAVAAPRAPAG